MYDTTSSANVSQNERGSTQRGMRNGPDNRLVGQVKLQMVCRLLHHKVGDHAGNIYLCAEETARQALINVMVACGDVPRMMDRSMALVTIDSFGELVEGMYMKRSKQHHRHIYQQYNPRKQLLPASNAVMC